ncbi:TIGR02594 family protein [Aureispira sp. CCB-QB1]|uniref:NlpC/P60 family protein n=1 Tax=Aureispira sp. CCB-QB1 TaxID=1313421 RepID=UPI000696A2C6|nr:TIGR02594 family protein [Aureispira sp. CCB-QB1]
MKLQKLAKLRETIRKYEDTIRYYEKLFMADGQIDSNEQLKLNKLNTSLKKIANKIEAKEKALSSSERIKNALQSHQEGIKDWSSTKDDTVDHTLVNEPTSSKSISGSVGRKGDNKKSDVSLVQNLLREKNNAPLKGSGICGPKTIKAIKNFQQKVEEADTGIITPNDNTWKKLNAYTPIDKDNKDNKDLDLSSIKNSVGKKGVNDKEDVKIVQELLKKKGGKLIGLGICGPLTISAIKKFQSINLNGFSDGLVEPDGKTFKLLVGNGKPISSDDINSNTGPLNKPNWIKIAEGEKGVKENTSKKKHNPRVLEYHASVKGNIKNDETPWCSSFVNWVMKKAGQGGTNSAMAISWKKYGKNLGKPAYGAIAVIDWDGAGPGWKGHVGFVVGKKGEEVLLLGGNQRNAVNIKSYSTSKVVAYVVPSNYEVPANAYSFGEFTGDYGSGGGMNSTR